MSTRTINIRVAGVTYEGRKWGGGRASYGLRCVFEIPDDEWAGGGN